MINLLKETEDALSAHKKTGKGVLWVGSTREMWKISWRVFKKIANFDYDNGYGGNEIVSHLVVVGKDFWLERWEYDGSEGWVYKTFPDEPKRTLRGALRGALLEK